MRVDLYECLLLNLFDFVEGSVFSLGSLTFKLLLLLMLVLVLLLLILFSFLGFLELIIFK